MKLPTMYEQCKKCGLKLIAPDSILLGYCLPCVTTDPVAKAEAEKMGLLKRCSCGNTLRSDESISSGMCLLCRKKL